MGATSANKLRQIIDNVYRIVAIELLISTQALEFHRPLKSSPKIEKVFSKCREQVPFLDRDRILKKDIDILEQLIRSGSFEEFYWHEIN